MYVYVPPSPSISFSLRVADAVCIWLKTAKAEVIKDKAFLKLLKELQDCLEKDGLTLQMTSLTSYLAESIKSSSVASSPISIPHSHLSFLKVEYNLTAHTTHVHTTHTHHTHSVSSLVCTSTMTVSLVQSCSAMCLYVKFRSKIIDFLFYLISFSGLVSTLLTADSKSIKDPQRP